MQQIGERTTIALQVILGVFAAVGLFAVGRLNYLLFHAVAELFSITVAMAVFMLAWNARRALANGYLLFLGLAFLFIAALDFVHMLAFKGMGVLPGNDANAATQLWIAGRGLQAASLLVAPAFLRLRARPGLTIVAYAAALALILLAIFAWQVFPDCYVEGVGLTTFKIVSEYVICGVLLGGAARLLAYRARFSRPVLLLLCASIAATILSELAFTHYVSVYGDANLVGHLLKVVAFYLVYKAIVETGVRRPYELLFRDLQDSEARHRVLFEGSLDAVLFTRPDGTILDANAAACALFGYTRDEFRTLHRDDIVVADDPRLAAALDERDRTGRMRAEYVHRRKDGSTFLSEVSGALFDHRGQRAGFIILRDVTERRQAEEQIKTSLAEKEVLLKEVHHRVKNNLQIISSLVSLQMEGLTEGATRVLLEDVRDRVRTMALVHEKLYGSDDLSRIEFAGYAKSLLTSLWRTHGALAASVRLALDLEPVGLPIATAVPCGLILNELAGNTLKHAFRGRDGGVVTVSLCADGAGRVRLGVRDDGVGLPPQLDWRRARSLGLRLVQMLTGQLGGTVEARTVPAGGTEFEVSFDVRQER